MRQSDERVDALFSITQSLRLLNLSEWTWTILDWLNLYTGFEKHVPTIADPVICTSRVLEAFARRRGETTFIASDVALELERQAFLHWHVVWTDESGRIRGPAWQPFSVEEEVPFLSFFEAKPDGAERLKAHELVPKHVDGSFLRNWLVEGYLRLMQPKPVFGC